MGKLYIGLDFDDVIADTHSMKPLLAKDFYGVDIEPNLFNRQHVLSTNLLSQDQYYELTNYLYTSVMDLNPIKDSVSTVKFLLAEGHKIKIVTSRQDSMLFPVSNFLSKYSLDIPVVGVGYATSKADYCHGFDLFVDDEVTKLRDLLGVVPKQILFTRDSNRNVKVNPPIIRIDDWESLQRFIMDLVC